MFLRPLKLVFEAVLHSFSQWIRTMGKYCILNEVHLSSIRLQRYKIPWCFRQECQLNARYSHVYCLLTKREKFSWSLFFPLLDLTLLPVYIMTVIKVKLRGRVKSFSFGEQNSSLIWWVYDKQFVSFVTNNILFVDRCIWCLQTIL